MKSLVLALALMAGCAPTYRSATKKCPPTALVMSDVLVGSAALLVSTFKWAAEKHYESLAFTTIGGGFILGASLAESTCRK